MAHKVLIVDDEQNILDVLSEALANEPYEVVTALSAKEGLSILGQEKVDLVLSDEKMPGMTGSELLAIVRQEYPNVIRMMFTAHPSMDLAIRAINEGQVSFFLTKPFKIVDLIMAFRHALRHRDLEMESRRMLNVMKKQNALLGSLRERGGGFSRANQFQGEVVVIADEDYVEWEELVKQMEEEVAKGEALMKE